MPIGTMVPIPSVGPPGQRQLNFISIRRDCHRSGCIAVLYHREFERPDRNIHRPKPAQLPAGAAAAPARHEEPLRFHAIPTRPPSMPERFRPHVAHGDDDGPTPFARTPTHATPPHAASSPRIHDFELGPTASIVSFATFVCSYFRDSFRLTRYSSLDDKHRRTQALEGADTMAGSGAHTSTCRGITKARKYENTNQINPPKSRPKELCEIRANSSHSRPLVTACVHRQPDWTW
jgi:hypothetical protein